MIFLHIVMKVALFTRKIVMKVALFTRKIVAKVVLFCIIHFLGDDCQSIPIFFFVIFNQSFWTKFLNLHRYAKK
jgi:hypothetical protein